MNRYEEFGQKLTEFLNEQERNASWLAAKVGRDTTNVNRWMNGETRPGSKEKIVDIAEALELSISQCKELIESATYLLDDKTETTIEQKLTVVLEEAGQPSKDQLKELTGKVEKVKSLSEEILIRQSSSPDTIDPEAVVVSPKEMTRMMSYKYKHCKMQDVIVSSRKSLPVVDGADRSYTDAGSIAA